ncbi:hypothetical protein V1525DRAFT_420434 [Lipomyces kononenkoae]|uniref:Uncharacterized protein n=1 Tax=Lipomyces kononenkoae TaxID=34357 RepID=A0ACC3SXR0_LIPKO
MSSHSERVVACIHALRDSVPTMFILVGGAAAHFQGHQRVVDGFEVVGEKLSYRSIQIDLLFSIDNKISYEQVDEHVEAIQGLRVLKMDFALAVKVRCSYLRAEDVTGIEKRRSDLEDAVFWAIKLQEAGMLISDSCAKLFPISYYQVLFLRISMRANRFHQLVDVGLRKLLIPWEENSPEQQEYYSYFAGKGSDPFTVDLSGVEEDDGYIE